MSIEFQTIELADGRQVRRATSRPDRLALHGSTAARPRPESVDPQVLREMRRLEVENSALKAEQRRSQLGLQYKRRVDSLVLAGTKRARAVQMASRENPVGRAAYLQMTNRADRREEIEAQTVAQPLNGGSAADQARADLFERKVSAELKRLGGDRRAAIRCVGRQFLSLHQAWCRCKSGDYAGR